MKIVKILKEISRKPVFRVLTSVVILGLLLANLPVDRLSKTISSVTFGLWASILCAFLIGHLLSAFKWRVWINTGKTQIPLTVALRAHFTGLFANLFLPSIAGGDLIRVGLAIKHNNGTEEVIFGTFLDRFLDMVALVLLIWFGVYLVPKSLTPYDRKMLSWMFWILTVSILTGILILTLPFLEGLPVRLRQIVLRVRKSALYLFNNPIQSLAAFFLSILIQLSFVFLGTLFARDCGVDLSLSVWLLAWPLAKLFATLPISVGGIGVREVALATILTRFGVPFEKSVGIGLLWESILIAGGCLGGVFYFIFRKNSKKILNFAHKSESYQITGV